MDLNLIKKLVRIVDTSEITDLEVEENGLRVKIAKKIRMNNIQQGIGYSAVPVLQPEHSIPSAPPREGETSKDSKLHEIKSPIVGTFYRAPAPDADPYIQIGDIVSPGSVLCIVEAMKLMNEIESDVSGKIVKIIADNGKPVEYNQPLFLVQLD
jgi:acetyl-CoA carboxylase biotin carboxyl carrier protein